MENEDTEEEGTNGHLLVIGDTGENTVGRGCEYETVRILIKFAHLKLVKYIERLFELVNAKEKEQKNFCCYRVKTFGRKTWEKKSWCWKPYSESTIKKINWKYICDNLLSETENSDQSPENSSLKWNHSDETPPIFIGCQTETSDVDQIVKKVLE